MFNPMDAVLLVLRTLLLYIPWVVGTGLLTLIALNLANQLCYGKERVDKLHSRVVLITGCDSGFGNFLAKRLDSLGFKVVATCLTPSGRAELEKCCTSKMQTMILDVTDDRSISDVFQRVSKLLEGDPSLEFWALVNNAGIATYGGFVDWMSKDEMKTICEVNLWGSVGVTKAFAELLKQSQGRLVFMSSSLGRMCLPSSASYSISKYGIEAFADCLRIELGLFNVEVSLIEPGWFKTAITDTSTASQQLQRRWDNLPQYLKDQVNGTDTFRDIREQAIALLSSSSPRVELVVQAMEHAVVAKHPKSRYWVGWDMILFVSWFCLLPSGVQDAFCRFKTTLRKGIFASNISKRTQSNEL